MTAYLLDVNVLIALAWPEHESHDKAQHWFARAAGKGWATCPMVEAGFVRIISNPAFSAHAVSPREAMEALDASTRHPDHRFWPDTLPLPNALAPFADQQIGHQQITDLYLLSLAIHHKGKFATLDKRLEGLFPPGSSRRAHMEII